MKINHVAQPKWFGPWTKTCYRENLESKQKAQSRVLAALQCIRRMIGCINLGINYTFGCIDNTMCIDQRWVASALRLDESLFDVTKPLNQQS